MSATILAGEATVVTDFAGGEVIHDGAVAWEGERIVAVGPRQEVEAEHGDAERLDAAGGVVVPGLVNLHHHFYSSLARGLDPGVAMENFPQVLDRLWWRLDRALDLETVGISAELALEGCIRGGCTTVFDHHASPSAIDGSLDVVAAAVEKAGLSAVLCYEITDRNGPEGAENGLAENLRFVKERRNDPRIRGVVGLHASFTLGDGILEAVADRRGEGVGVHVHLAEDPVDGDFTRRRFGVGPVERLDRFGLLDERALLAHGIHLDPREYARVGEAGAVILHNPESNAHNGVGRLDPVRARQAGCAVGLGTDGMSGSLLRALRSAFLLHRHARRDPSAGFEALPELLAQNAAVARRFLDRPRLGRLEPGAPADLAVFDAPPPTPFTPANTFGHLVYGLAEASARHTVAHGRLLLRDFELQTLYPKDLARRARAVAPELWRRFHDLDWGTPYLGPDVGPEDPTDD